MRSWDKYCEDNDESFDHIKQDSNSCWNIL